MAITGLADRFRASHVCPLQPAWRQLLNGGFVLARSEPTLRCSNALHDGALPGRYLFIAGD